MADITKNDDLRIYGGGGDKIVELGLTVCIAYCLVLKVPRVNKEKVLAMHRDGLSRNAIAKHFGCARGTISKVLHSVDSNN